MKKLMFSLLLSVFLLTTVTTAFASGDKNSNQRFEYCGIKSTEVEKQIFTDAEVFISEDGFGINADNLNLIRQIKLTSAFTSRSSVLDIIDGDKVSVDGGNLWAQWKGARHRAIYYHESKEHRSTAKNRKGVKKRSSWENGSIKAISPWINSTLTGNKVYGATR